MFVDSDYHRQGIATELMRIIGSELKKITAKLDDFTSMVNQYKKSHYTSNKTCITAYKSHSYFAIRASKVILNTKLPNRTYHKKFCVVRPKGKAAEFFMIWHV